jgi:hypothetical protein
MKSPPGLLAKNTRSTVLFLVRQEKQQMFLEKGTFTAEIMCYGLTGTHESRPYMSALPQ